MTKCFAVISVFWILVRVFVNAWSPILRHGSICKCCSDFITVIFKETETLCFIGIHQVFYSDQCFLEFGKCFSWVLDFKYLDAVCLWKLLMVCCSTYQQSENNLLHRNSPNNLLQTVFSEFWWCFWDSWYHLSGHSSICKGFS